MNAPMSKAQMSEPEVRGLCPPAFDMVRRAFADNFARGEELGARFTVTLDGEVVVDLMGGFADRARTRPFAEDTLTPIFSTMKAVAAILIARLVDQGRLDYGQRVAEVWPEFAPGRQGGRSPSSRAALPPGRTAGGSLERMRRPAAGSTGTRSAGPWRR